MFKKWMHLFGQWGLWHKSLLASEETSWTWRSVLGNQNYAAGLLFEAWSSKTTFSRSRPHSHAQVCHGSLIVLVFLGPVPPAFYSWFPGPHGRLSRYRVLLILPVPLSLDPQHNEIWWHRHSFGGGLYSKCFFDPKRRFSSTFSDPAASWFKHLSMVHLLLAPLRDTSIVFVFESDVAG